MDQKKQNPILKAISFAEEKRSAYVISVLFAICGSVCSVLPYFVMAGIVKDLLAGSRNMADYLGPCLYMGVLWTGRVLCHGISTTFSHKATFSVLGNIRRRSLKKLENMPLGEVQNLGSGSLKNILCERIDSMETTLAHIVPEVTGNILAVLITLVYLFFIDWRMALASLITFPLGMFCMCLMFIGYEENYGRVVRSTKALNDTAVEYIGGMEVIKVFGKAKKSYDKFAAAAREGAACYVDWMRKCNIPFTLALNLMPATLLPVLPIGGLLLRNGSLSVSQFIMVVILSMGLITPIIAIYSYSDDVAKLGTIMEEVTSILEAPEMPRPEQDLGVPADNSITMENVHFSYVPGKEVLHGIDLTMKSGTVNALVGPSGGGKSTIAKLIASFWDPTQGSVRLGGVDIRQLSKDTYARKIAYVSQDNFLFDDTVRENIRMGNPDATDQQVEQAAKDCGCYDFIMELEQGFDTRVGGGGSHLSGGEKQRICIARAMLKDAPIIILDEATAYTDPENEALIQASLAKLIAGRTLIVIAHRLSTIVDADRIFLISSGTVAASGTHDQLLTVSPLYEKLWQAHISSRDTVKGEN